MEPEIRSCAAEAASRESSGAARFVAGTCACESRHDLQAKVVPGPSLNKSRHPSEATPCQEIKATGLDAKYAQIRTYIQLGISYTRVSVSLLLGFALLATFGAFGTRIKILLDGIILRHSFMHFGGCIHHHASLAGNKKKMAWDFESNRF